MTTLPIMNDDELGRCEVTLQEAGFGGLETDRGMLPMRAMKVDTHIVGLTARTTLRQTFRNVHDTRLEATYIFPLPSRAAVRHFRMVVDGRVIDGELQERGKARETYDRAIASGQRASIVEQERPDVFTIRVGNLAPGEEAEIEFELVGPLVFADGEATWRFPLVVAPRYVPGTPIGDDVGTGVAPDTDQVPDASRITPPTMLPGFPNPVELQMRVAIDGAGLPLTDLRGSLPATIEGEGDRRVVEVTPGQRLNKDFVVRFRTTRDDVATSLTWAPDADGELGTFELTVMPPQPSIEARKPRDVVFVLDRSGSMGGWKMVAARRAMARMVDTLTPTDRFTCIAFDTVNEVPDDHGGGLVQATDRARWRASEFLAKIDARGGTSLDGAIQAAIERVGEGYDDRERQIIVVTDGQVSQEAYVLELVQQHGKGIRFFTVGIDRAVNASLLQRIAEHGGGACELVEGEDRLDDVMSAMHRRMDAVVVDELSLSVEGVEVEAGSLAPARHDALFAGVPLIVRGRGRRGGGNLRAVVAGRRAQERFETAVEGVERDERAIGSMWARHRLINLEDRYDATGQQSLIETITALSLEHRVLCRFTAFVAVDKEGKVDTSQPMHEVTQLVEPPEMWAQASAAMAPRAMAKGAPGAPVNALRSASPQMQADGMVGGSGSSMGDADDLLEAPEFLRQSRGEEKKKESKAKSSFRRMTELLTQPSRATENDVLIAVLVYLVSGAWTLERTGLDPHRSAAVLTDEILQELVRDLEAALARLATTSTMVPDGPLPAFSASYSMGEAASIVSQLSVDDPDAIAGSTLEELELRDGVVGLVKSSREAFWK